MGDYWALVMLIFRPCQTLPCLSLRCDYLVTALEKGGPASISVEDIQEQFKV